MTLTSVSFQLPAEETGFGDKLLYLLSTFGRRTSSRVIFSKSNPAFVPEIAMELHGSPETRAVFGTSDLSYTIAITNKTGQEWLSPETYTAISINECASRLSSATFIRLDHLGFNLPWPVGEVHPDILKLRKYLAPQSAYYLFPTGENWDFILPASAKEITSDRIDLGIDRRPKIEIVSFEKASTPLIQIDFSINKTYKAIAELFPEGLHSPALKNVWVYLQNPYGIDICFVIGEHRPGDWSSFFTGHQLLNAD